MIFVYAILVNSCMAQDLIVCRPPFEFRCEQNYISLQLVIELSVVEFNMVSTVGNMMSDLFSDASNVASRFGSSHFAGSSGMVAERGYGTTGIPSSIYGGMAGAFSRSSTPQQTHVPPGRRSPHIGVHRSPSPKEDH